MREPTIKMKHAALLVCLLYTSWAFGVGTGYRAAATFGTASSWAGATASWAGAVQGIWFKTTDGKAYVHTSDGADTVIGAVASPVLTTSRVCQGTILSHTLVKMGTTAGRVTQCATTDGADVPTGVAIQGCTDGQTITVQEIRGVETQIRSDGTTVIASGDPLEYSTTIGGYVKKGIFGSGKVVMSATSAGVAVVDTLVGAL